MLDAFVFVEFLDFFGGEGAVVAAAEQVAQAGLHVGGGAKGGDLARARLAGEKVKDVAVDLGGEQIGLEAAAQQLGQLITNRIKSFHQVIWDFDGESGHRLSNGSSHILV